MKIVVRTPNWIGDTLMALPAMAALRRHHSADEIWIAAPAGIRDIFAGPETKERLFVPDAAAENASLRHAAAAWRTGRFDAGAPPDEFLRLGAGNGPGPDSPALGI